jgi:catechol 2,3-dioxygenase-like lactoylglutathione lyase family enzyme
VSHPGDLLAARGARSGVQHVALEVRRADTDAEVRFWRMLGFAEVDPPEALRSRSRWVEREGTQVHLLVSERPVVAPEGHVAVAAADYAAVLEALRGAAVAVDERTEHWGAPRCFVRSPAGHRVELMARAPGAGA